MREGCGGDFKVQIFEVKISVFSSVFGGMQSLAGRLPIESSPKDDGAPKKMSHLEPRG